MVRRRRDQRRPGLGVTEAGDKLVDLVRGELSALAGLRALCQLDLQILRRANVFNGHAETAGGDLLDRAVLFRPETFWIFAAFAGVGHRAKPVEGKRDGLVRLRRKRTERHRPADEMFNDVIDGFDIRFFLT